MGDLSHEDVLDVVDTVCVAFPSSQGYVVRQPAIGSLKVATIACDSWCSMITAVEAPDAGIGTFIHIAGGGAWGARADSPLYEHLVTRCLDFDWGGPFARVVHGATVYGTRVVVPSSILTSENLMSAYGFLGGMVKVLGEVARTVATELVPRYGGELFGDGGPDDDLRLLIAIFGTTES
jgi:hypothetical protein